MQDAWWGEPATHVESVERLPSARGVLDRWVESQEAMLEGGFSTTELNPAFDLDELGEASCMLLSMIEKYDAAHGNCQDDGSTLIGTEVELEVPIPARRADSTVLTFLGYLDKLTVDVYGQYWVVEHKTTVSDLDKWIEQHAYQPQAAGYVWALMKQGHKVGGVVYDLTRKATARLPEDWGVLKSGKSLYKKPPSVLDAGDFARTLALNGFTVDGDDSPLWYAELMDKLNHQQNPYSRRTVLRYTQSDLDRVASELYIVGSEIHAARRKSIHLLEAKGRQQRLLVEDPARAGIHQEEWRGEAHRAIVEHGNCYPRNQSACQRWGKPCPILQVCQYRQRDSMELVQLRKPREVSNG
jgi:hypothetical protein